MFVVLGATGNVGSSVLRVLSQTGQPVIAITHSADKAAALEADNIEAAVVDVADVQALRDTLKRGTRAFLLNPPADPGGDTNAEELATARSITQALEGTGLEKIVVESTYGAQEGEAIGDLSVLHEFEQWAKARGIATAINRGAYYFTNLDMLLEPAKEGVVPTAFPAAMRLPMVAPADLGEAAAARLLSPIDDVGIRYVEGPEHYSFGDVAAAFARALGRDVKVETTPREKIAESFGAIGFSPEAARSYARMTEVTIDGPEAPKDPWRGKVTLEQYISGLVAAA
jgi:uncharacterized protein YbjT (DUF2867 family)